jgi:cytoskeletal protein CcmA (bactofilin family)
MSAAPSFGIESPAAKAGLGKSVVVKGHLLSGEDLAIDGEVEGTIEVLEHCLTIAASGRVRADVNARDIEIWGCLEGELEAVNRVHIRTGARFVGEIHAAGLVIEEGGYIRGSIDLSRHPAPNLNTSKVEPIRQRSDAVLRS